MFYGPPVIWNYRHCGVAEIWLPHRFLGHAFPPEDLSVWRKQVPFSRPGEVALLPGRFRKFSLNVQNSSRSHTSKNPCLGPLQLVGRIAPHQPEFASWVESLQRPHCASRSKIHFHFGRGPALCARTPPLASVQNARKRSPSTIWVRTPSSIAGIGGWAIPLIT